MHKVSNDRGDRGATMRSGEQPVTLKAAKEAGFVEASPRYYGGEQIRVKGHLLVRNPNEALSRTEWQRRGRVVPEGESSHAVIGGHFGGKYQRWPVYREDQTQPFAPGKARPGEASPLRLFEQLDPSGLDGDPSDLCSPEVFDRVSDQGIRPHASEIERITAVGELPVVVFEPGELARQALARLGWRGERIFAISKPAALRAFGRSKPLVRRWIMGPSTGGWLRVIVFAQDAILLMDRYLNRGFLVELNLRKGIVS